MVRPTLSSFNARKHISIVSFVSTKMKSNAELAVDTATSYFSSIAPKSPCKHSVKTQVQRQLYVDLISSYAVYTNIN